MKLSHLNALRALEATLRYGSFSAAAEELGISPAAVGQRVRSLEAYLGKDLFLRSATGLRASEGARKVETQLTDSFSGLAKALIALKSEVHKAHLSVTLPASFVENWLAPSISEFYRRHASVDLRLDASNRDVDLVSESFDFAVRYGTQVDAQLDGVVLFEDYVLPVCSPGFAQEYGVGSGQRSLRDIPLIHITDRTSDPSWVGFDAWGRAFGFDPTHLDHGVHFFKVSSGLQSAIAGQGLVLCGLVEAFHAMQSGILVAPFGPALRCRTEGMYRLLWVRDRPIEGLQADFRQWLVEKSAVFKTEMEGFFGVTPEVG